MENTKPIFKSKMVWFNIFATAAQLFVYGEEIVPMAYLPYFLTAQGFVNVILRVWFTNTKLVKTKLPIGN